MSCEICECDSAMSNTGVGCDVIFKDTLGLIFVPKYKSDGTLNGIVLATDTINQAFVTAKVNAVDASERWYPVPSANGIKDVEQVRAESKYKTFADDSKQFIRKGLKNFMGFLTGLVATPVLVGKLDAVRCSDGMTVYKIDRDGNLIGSISSDGTILYGIDIDPESFDSQYVEPLPNDVAMVKIQFDFSVTHMDQNLKAIKCSSITANLLMLRGLIDVCVEVSDITDTGFTATLTTDFGGAGDPTLDEGLEEADFTIVNETDADANVPITDFEETSPGVYVFTFASQDPLDILHLVPVKNGRDYTCVINTDITIPT
jgi:hypothetical protein